MSEAAQAAISALNRGEDVRASWPGLIVNQQPDPDALQALGKELGAAGSHMRERIVRLLVDLGRATDPLTPRGADVIRNRRILELLSGPGLAQPDAGREAAMDALRKLATPAALSSFAPEYVHSLESAPSVEGFLLVAKAKPMAAKLTVVRVATLAAWKPVEGARVARAALGDTAIEDEFLQVASTAEAASDGRALARALGTLGLIGTRRTLKAVAERLRTPLTILVPNASEQSVRLSVLEALLYNFPDQPELYPNNINSDEGYAAAERFCTSTLGVTYTQPRPPYMKFRGFPIPLAK